MSLLPDLDLMKQKVWLDHEVVLFYRSLKKSGFQIILPCNFADLTSFPSIF